MTTAARAEVNVQSQGVRLRGLRKTYKHLGSAANEVLRGVDLDVARGEVVGLIGPNGAGKTTLMSCLLGFLFPDGGEIAIGGKSNDDLSVRARTGFVPERMNFDRLATGRSFLQYMGRLAKVRDLDARIDRLLVRLDIAGAAIPTDMQGKSLVPILTGKTPADWRKSVYYHYYEFPQPHHVHPHYGVRTDRYKLISFYTIDAWELFDLEKDPHELRNVYGEKPYARVTQELKAELMRLRREYRDNA